MPSLSDRVAGVAQRVLDRPGCAACRSGTPSPRARRRHRRRPPGRSGRSRRRHRWRSPGSTRLARTSRISSRSKPSVVPSASIAFSRISPAPSSAARTAHSRASRPADVRPPWVVTSKPESVPGRPRRASTESTSTWLPNRSAISATSSGRRIAAVLTAILSAPARSSRSTSSTLPTPPPTVSGMNTCSAVRETISIVVDVPRATPRCRGRSARRPPRRRTPWPARPGRRRRAAAGS